MAGLCAPLSTLRQYPHGYLRMTRGRCGSLLLHRDGLAPSTPCRSPGALRSTPINRHFQSPLACLKSVNCRRTTFADDAAGESKRIVLGSRWLGGTLHAEAGRSCTVRRRLIGARGEFTIASVAMFPQIESL